jgi:hypothetical protein
MQLRSIIVHKILLRHFFYALLLFDPTGFYTGKTEWMIMMKRTNTIFLTAILAICLLIIPAMAAITNIYQGNTVFLGEEGLDVSSAVGADNQIGWWASGADIYNSPTSGSVSITDKTQFYVTPSLFGTKLGTWYRLAPSGKANGTAFTVADPYLNLRVEDTSVGVDVTPNKWVYRGDLVGFRIETNLNVIASQRGTPATIAIKVQPPGGGEYSALVNNGVTTDVTSIAVTSSPQDTGAIWDTGNSAYAPGTYTIWAECNSNRMKDNYVGDVTGKVVSTKTSMLNTEFNPLIGVNVPTTSPTTQVIFVPTTVTTTSPTTKPTTAVITTVPPIPTTSIPPTTATTIPAPETTTPKKSPGFGIVATAISLSLIAALVLKKFS